VGDIERNTLETHIRVVPLLPGMATASIEMLEYFFFTMPFDLNFVEGIGDRSPIFGVDERNPPEDAFIQFITNSNNTRPETILRAFPNSRNPNLVEQLQGEIEVARRMHNSQRNEFIEGARRDLELIAGFALMTLLFHGVGAAVASPDFKNQVKMTIRKFHTGTRNVPHAFRPSGRSFRGGAAGEAHLADLVGGQSQVQKKTSLTFRRIDQLDGLHAHEAKVGFVSNSESYRIQAKKDAELIRTGQIESSTWHFLRSEITGRIGASQSFLDFLTEMGINYVIHY